MAIYEVGAQFIDKSDSKVIATVIEKRLIHNIPHYQLSIEPNLYNAQPRWLSEYGILIEYAPRTPRLNTARKSKPSIAKRLGGIFG